jgi:biotin-(acetyl-CoA carboxylase) ligase
MTTRLTEEVKWNTMPDESPKSDAVEKLLSEEASLQTRKEALIAELLKQKEATAREFDEKKLSALKAIDERLAKLGHHANSRIKRSHHKKSNSPVGASPKDKLADKAKG